MATEKTMTRKGVSTRSEKTDYHESPKVKLFIGLANYECYLDSYTAIAAKIANRNIKLYEGIEKMRNIGLNFIHKYLLLYGDGE